MMRGVQVDLGGLVCYFSCCGNRRGSCLNFNWSPVSIPCVSLYSWGGQQATLKVNNDMLFQLFNLENILAQEKQLDWS